jgi:hypothetical protein
MMFSFGGGAYKLLTIYNLCFAKLIAVSVSYTDADLYFSNYLIEFSG